jgi:hypothetical protein
MDSSVNKSYLQTWARPIINHNQQYGLARKQFKPTNKQHGHVQIIKCERRQANNLLLYVKNGIALKHSHTQNKIAHYHFHLYQVNISTCICSFGINKFAKRLLLSNSHL